MEKRKIIGLGNNSLVISLPKDWVIKNKLKKGDELIITNSEKELRIMTEEKAKPTKTATIKLSDNYKDDFIKIISYYLSGYDIIKIENINNNQFKQLEKSIREAIFCDIIHSKNYILIKDVTDIAEINFYDMVNRIFELVNEMINSYFKKQNYEDAENSINKFYYTLLRNIRIKLRDKDIENSEELLNLWIITFHLEKIGDSLKILSKDKNTKEFIKNFQKTFCHVWELFNKRDVKKASELLRKVTQLYSEKNIPRKAVDMVKYLKNILRVMLV